MAAKNTDLTIRWPFAPTHVRTNSDTGLLKLIAMIAMLCDHAGKMLFPQYGILRIIGRIAFPIYAYCIAVGCVYTRSPFAYLKRIALLALISQPIYVVAMGHSTKAMYALSFADHPVRAALTFYAESWAAKPSILFALAVGVLLICAIRERQLVFAVAMALVAWLLQDKLDYGIRGIALMLLFYLFCDKRWLSLPLVAAFMIWWGMKGSGYKLFGVSFSTQMFALMALPLIYINTNSRCRLPKWLFYSFYPLHLALIYALDHFVF